MEQPKSIFSLSIDPVTKSNLSETAKWARFLAITGMISLVLLLMLGFYLSTVMTSNLNRQLQEADVNFRTAPGIGIGLAFIYILIAVVWFFPLMFLLRFANQMRASIKENDQEKLNLSFQNLKICFRYLGIVTVISIALYILSFLFTISSADNMVIQSSSIQG